MPAKKECCVPFCSSNQETKISFHEFPSNFTRRYEWLKAISRDNFTPSEYSKVCGYHFQESDFIHLNKRTILKKNALPSIFKGYPTFMTDQDSSFLKHKETIDKGYAGKIRLLKEANFISNEIQALLNSGKCQQLRSKVELLNNSSVDKTSTSVLNTEEFVDESPLTQIENNSTSSNQRDKTSSSNKVNLQIGAQHNINNPYIIRPKRLITESDFPNKKFNRFDSYRLSSLKRNVTSTIKKIAPDHINTSFTSRKMKISPLPKNEAVKLLSQSSCSLKTTQLVSYIGKKKSSESIPTLSVVNLPQQNAVKNYSSKKSQLNISKFRSIRPKQPILLKGSSENNGDNLYILNVSKPTAPTIIKACPIKSENNNSDPPNDKADNIFSVKKILNATSPSKNGVENLLGQSNCFYNEKYSNPIAKINKFKLSASKITDQPASSLTCSLNNEIIAPDLEELESEDTQVVYVSTMPSKNNSSETNSNNITFQVGRQPNVSKSTAVAAKSSMRHIDFLKKIKKKDTNLSLKNNSDLRRKIRSLQSQLCQKNKQNKSLKTEMEVMSEKLEYFENDTVLQNVEKMKVIDKEGLATKQMKFILNQISNLDKKAPRWSKEVIRECVLLHASSPKAYEALLKTELFKLPKRSTLMRFASSTNSQTRNNLDSELESELTTEIINYEPEFDVVVNEIASDHSSGNVEEDLYFNTSITDMF